jgi:carboxymethylenebutenolidase
MTDESEGGSGMRRIVLLAIWILIVLAPDAFAESVKTENVTFASGTETIAGYLATPETPGKHPALLVLHSDGGLTNWIKEQTRKLAAEGYVALAVDLYRGHLAFDPELAYNLTISVPPARAFSDMEAAVHFLVARADVNKDKVGSIGWSVGGKWSLLLAENDPFLAACVSHYGLIANNPAEIQKIHAPVLGIFGADDLIVLKDDVEAFDDAMTGAHKSFEMKIYRGTGHDFEDPSNKLGFREGTTEDAWKLTLSFLERHLK